MKTAGGYLPSNDNDVIHIQDADLARTIKDSLKIPHEQELTYGDMKKLKKLTANVGEKYQYQDVKITNLNGMQYATNLEELWLHGNKVTSLEPIKGLTKLKILNVNHNDAITDLTPLQNLTNLERLMIERNNFTTLEPLRNLTKINMLNVGANNISDLSPLENMNNMVSLYISDTNVEDISVVENFENLSLLQAYDTPIKDLSYVKDVKTVRLVRPIK